MMNFDGQGHKKLLEDCKAESLLPMMWVCQGDCSLQRCKDRVAQSGPILCRVPYCRSLVLL